MIMWRTLTQRGRGHTKPQRRPHEVDAPKKLAQETRVIIIYSKNETEGEGKTNMGRPFSRAPNAAAATRGSKKTEQRRQNSASLRHDDTGGLLGTLLDPVRVNLVFREVPV